MIPIKSVSPTFFHLILQAMKMNHRKMKKLSPDTLAFFQKAVEDAFSFLEPRHDFIHLSTEIDRDWEERALCTITYRGKQAEVHLIYSMGGQYVTCALSRLRRGSGNLLRPVESYGIDFLIKARCPERLIRQEYDKNGEEDIVRHLDNYAYVLKEYGQELLNGDPHAFRELKQAADEELRRISESGDVVILPDIS